jgi:hypothetical protein
MWWHTSSRAEPGASLPLPTSEVLPPRPGPAGFSPLCNACCTPAFVNGLDEAVARAREAAGGKDVGIGGGTDVIRQALRAGQVEELSISIAPVILAGGKRLFVGFDETVKLEHVGLLQSPFATHFTYRIGS